MLCRNNLKPGLRLQPGISASFFIPETSNIPSNLPPNPIAIRDELMEIVENSNRNDG